MLFLLFFLSCNCGAYIHAVYTNICWENDLKLLVASHACFDTVSHFFSSGCLENTSHRYIDHSSMEVKC